MLAPQTLEALRGSIGDAAFQQLMRQDIARLTALVDSRCCLFPRAAFDRFAHDHPELEHRLLGTVLDELDRARRTALAFATERRIAEYLDAKGLPRASVAVDTASGFAIVARSQRPLQFIETADPDFTQAVNAPTRHGVRYLLTVPPTGRGEADALNLRYPTLFEDGAGVAELEVEARNDAPDQPDWRLYRVLGAGS